MELKLAQTQVSQVQYEMLIPTGKKVQLRLQLTLGHTWGNISSHLGRIMCNPVPDFFAVQKIN